MHLSVFTELTILLLGSFVTPMTIKEKNSLRDEAQDMFYHGYYAYMENAFPADELMPLSCRGRFRGREPDRGDIDDALGNFSLTLIDSLDTLIVMGNLEEFEKGVKSVIEVVSFDHDISVSVFETNIRVIGGLVSAHIFSEMARDRFRKMLWYQGELLNMALDVGTRLLPAFNSTTGLPHPRVNLKYGIKHGKIKSVGETCTACAGTMILEFAALSRLSGEAIFEEKASEAMDVLWSSRHRMSNLVGNVLNINTGDWIRRDSGIGAGIDSYYEYVAKAYILLGEDKYLPRWEAHYTAIMKYLTTGATPALLQDVHMHKPSSNSKHFHDALGAFWPGLQVLMGDLKPAIESHEVLYQISVRHNFIPEAFTTDFQVHWGQHLLRPEFVESTYMLYKATKDPYYLEVGKKILKSLQKHARVTCGYASIKDVRTLQQDDRMDSFVLSETFKYLYLLFAEERDLIIDIDNFIFTTEGHLLPLSLARLSSRTAIPLNKEQYYEIDEDVEYSRSCPSTKYMFPDFEQSSHFNHVREPLANIVSDKCPLPKFDKRRLLGSQFRYSDPDHMAIIKEMGISIVTLTNGRVQLVHTFSDARSSEDAEEGLLFMQEMIEMSKEQIEQPDTTPVVVSFFHEGKKEVITAGPAKFGKDLSNGFRVSGKIVRVNPFNGCGTILNQNDFKDHIVLIERGDCMFIDKARMAQSFGALGGIVVDNNFGSSSRDGPLFAMAGDDNDDVRIPVVFLFRSDAENLLEAMKRNSELIVSLSELVKDERVYETLEEDYSDSSSSFDFTSPVTSFLQKSKEQVENYFRVKTEDNIKEKNADTDSESIIKVENKNDVYPQNKVDNDVKGFQSLDLQKVLSSFLVHYNDTETSHSSLEETLKKYKDSLESLISDNVEEEMSQLLQNLEKGERVNLERLMDKISRDVLRKYEEKKKEL